MNTISAELSTRLEKAKVAKQKKVSDRIAQGLPATESPLEKAKRNPTSRSLAIAAKCYDCIYDPISGNGTWRQQVRACIIESCPLYSVRPK